MKSDRNNVRQDHRIDVICLKKTILFILFILLRIGDVEKW